uniref:DUF4238 domain-containing protein n=1 Tax=Acetatifactor sp. TaxID=1872090 RepID=UPI0040569DE9
MSNHQTKKKQHYISQGLLRHFSIDGNRIFECSIDQKKIYRTNIGNAMEENCLYEHPLLQENLLENAFANIEASFIPKISTIIEDIHTSSKSVEEIYNSLNSLYEIFLLFYYRSGAVLSEFSYGMNDSETKKRMRVRRLVEVITTRSYLKKLAASLRRGYTFSILSATDSEFVISDQYISTVALAYKNQFINSSNRAIGMKETMILLPLSHSFYIALFNGCAPQYIKPNQISHLTKDEVFQINKVIFHNSFKKCAGNSEELLNQLLREEYSSYGAIQVSVHTKGGKFGNYTNKKEIFLYDVDEDLNTFHIQYAIKYREMKDAFGKAHIRNLKCPCGSGNKFKTCCLSKYQRAYQILEETQKPESQNYLIPGCIAEMPIYEFWHNSN